MTVAARDPWVDAWQVATQPVLDQRLASLRRAIWIRRVAGIVAVCAVLFFGTQLAFRTLDDSYESLWPSSTALFATGLGLMGLGLVLMVGGAARGLAKDLNQSFVGPDAFLPRSERAWMRQQIAAGHAVAPRRRDVVTAMARRMRSEGNQVLVYLGLCSTYAGSIVAGPSPSSLVVFGALIVWLTVISVRALVWSRRARRWLALHAEPAR